MNALILTLLLPAAGMAAGNLPIQLVQTMPLPGVHGHFDHFAVDVAGRHLFLAAEGAHAVEVVDLATGARLAQIQDAKKPHAIFFMLHRNLIFVTDGAAGTCGVSDAPEALRPGEDGRLHQVLQIRIFSACESL